MLKRIYQLKAESGLHARPASLIVAEASKYPNVTLSISKNNKDVNLKSIMGVMSLAVGQYDEIQITAVGENDEQALDNIEKVMLQNELI